MKNKIQYKVLWHIVIDSIILFVVEIMAQIVFSNVYEHDAVKQALCGYWDVSLAFQNRPGLLMIHYSDLLRVGIFGFFLIPYMYGLMKMIQRNVTKPLLNITEEISRIRDKDIQAHLETKVDCEFLQLENEFNRLMDCLGKAINERQKSEDEKLLLISGMAHDLKTPITAIRGYSQAFRDGVVCTHNQQNEYLDVIYKKAIQMDELITALFDYTRLGTTQYRLNIEKLDLIELIREAIGLTYTEFEEKGIQFEFDFPQKEIWIKGDSVQLKRVFANLFSNALKYCHAGDSIHVDVKEADSMIIVVEDTGKAVPKELEDNLFDPFVMGDYARKSGNGNGLGLCIASKIVELHHGTMYLKIENQKKYTKSFWIDLSNIKE